LRVSRGVDCLPLAASSRPMGRYPRATRTHGSLAGAPRPTDCAKERAHLAPHSRRAGATRERGRRRRPRAAPPVSHSRARESGGRAAAGWPRACGPDCAFGAQPAQVTPAGRSGRCVRRRRVSARTESVPRCRSVAPRLCRAGATRVRAAAKGPSTRRREESAALAGCLRRPACLRAGREHGPRRPGPTRRAHRSLVGAA
jgi:hypothetical protein